MGLGFRAYGFRAGLRRFKGVAGLGLRHFGLNILELSGQLAAGVLHKVAGVSNSHETCVLKADMLPCELKSCT